MATEQELRSRLRKLEQQLVQQQQENQRIQAQIRQQTQAQILQTQQQMRREYRQLLNETTEAYAQRIRQTQEDILRQSREEISRLQEAARQQAEETRRTMEAMEACSRELQEELQKLRDDNERKNTQFRQFAEDARDQAEQARKQVSSTPHAFFCPQEFDIISTHLKDIQDLISQEMYQAAVSDAACIELEFNLLRAKVDQAFSEWLQAFEDYRTILEGLHAKIVVLRQRRLNTCAGNFLMKDAELNFWSSGAFEPLARQIETAYEAFCHLDTAGVVAYLQEQAGTDRKAIFSLVTQGKQWEDQLTAIISCIFSERILSDQRYCMAEEAGEQLERLNYRWEDGAFLPPEAGVADQSWYIAPRGENPLSSYELVMTLAQRNRLKLRLIPRREHGLAVENQWYLSFSITSACDDRTERAMADEALALITPVLRRVNPDAKITFLPRNQDPAKNLRVKEHTLNKTPSPEMQIRHITRKYR